MTVAGPQIPLSKVLTTKNLQAAQMTRTRFEPVLICRPSQPSGLLNRCVYGSSAPE